LYGQTPKNGGAWPTVQAYRSDLKPYEPLRLEFCTPAHPDSDVGPFVHWYPWNTGVTAVDDNTVKIPIRVISTGPRMSQ
jgi:hypothetical protein